MGLVIEEVTILREVAIDFSLEDILATPPLSKWRKSRNSRDQLEAAVERIRPEVERELNPRAIYRGVPTETSGIHAYSPPAPVTKAEFVGNIVVTPGELEYGNEHAEGMFDDFVRDAIENVAVQRLSAVVGQRFRDEANERGYNTTRLFAPGSGIENWPLENRRYVFDSLPCEEIGVRLTDAGQVEPNKTVSCVIGFGPDIEQAPGLVSCEGCSKLPDCPYAGARDAIAANT
ncbi:hypothetical protein RH858_11955 [Halalkaliarchaeum sp. AArc-GB]|uniref:hypothetical protein n=1 Tax=Halalkaliarchaeum sp. AArc-GB TaxID=3074078 RepID=UPI00285C4B1F|nr:hypothetical protein [Halalkaliarchaeum sp. AArc-GB]MDR5673856.1 hypothetical protein [Halalkaliarchaeum sp. AArc-GB]